MEDANKTEHKVVKVSKLHTNQWILLDGIPRKVLSSTVGHGSGRYVMVNGIEKCISWKSTGPGSSKYSLIFNNRVKTVDGKSVLVADGEPSSPKEGSNRRFMIGDQKVIVIQKMD